MKAKNLTTCSKCSKLGGYIGESAPRRARVSPLSSIYPLRRLIWGFNLEHLEHRVKWLRVLKLFCSKYRNILGTTWNTMSVVGACCSLGRREVLEPDGSGLDGQSRNHSIVVQESGTPVEGMGAIPMPPHEGLRVGEW